MWSLVLRENGHQDQILVNNLCPASDESSSAQKNFASPLKDAVVIGQSHLPDCNSSCSPNQASIQLVSDGYVIKAIGSLPIGIPLDAVPYSKSSFGVELNKKRTRNISDDESSDPGDLRMATMAENLHLLKHGESIALSMSTPFFLVRNQYKCVWVKEVNTHPVCKSPPNITNFFSKTRSNSALSSLTWTSIGTVLHGCNYTNDVKTSKDSHCLQPIAAFDIDGTIIKTASGKKFPKDARDWRFLNPKVLHRIKSLANGDDALCTVSDDDFDIESERLKIALAAKNKEMIEKGNVYRVVLFSNQLGFRSASYGTKRMQDVKDKLESICHQIAIPIDIFLAMEDDASRKPRTNMWNLYLEKLTKTHSSQFVVNYKKSFFVGDSAGRDNDFSASDLRFACNIGLTFFTPEAIFNGEPLPVLQKRVKDQVIALQSKNTFHPTLLEAPLSCHSASSPLFTENALEIVVLVGPPAAGKSTFCLKEMQKYVRVNQDTLGSKENCLRACERAMKDGRPVVIDNTNSSKEHRLPFIQLARKYNVPIRCFVFDVSRQLANHLNVYRFMMNGTKIPEIAYALYYKRFETPLIDEGYSEIRTIYFAEQFECDSHRKLFQTYLLES